MHVLAAHPTPDRYGADLMLLTALRALRRDGADVTVVVAEDGPLLADMRDADLDVRIVDVPVLRKALLRPGPFAGLAARSPSDVWRMRRLVEDIDPDVVYVNTLTIPHWIAAARAARRPVVCHVREAEDDPPEIVKRALVAPLLGSQRIITNSAHTARHLTDRFARLASRIEIVHNGFHFDAAPGRRAPRSPAEVLLVGRLSPRKGQDVAIEAVSELHRAGHPVRLRLIGTEFRGYEWYVDELRSSADRHGIADSVRFDGYRSDIAAANAAADVVIVPSRVEPFGNVAVEAMAAGRPLVASATGGLTEIVDDERTGLVVPPGDARALAAAIRRYLEDPEWAADVGSRAAAVVRDRFSIERYEVGVAQVLAGAARRH